MSPAFVWINTVLEMLYSSMIATVVSLVISAQEIALHNEHFCGFGLTSYLMKLNQPRKFLHVWIQ